MKQLLEDLYSQGFVVMGSDTAEDTLQQIIKGLSVITRFILELLAPTGSGQAKKVSRLYISATHNYCSVLQNFVQI